MDNIKFILDNIVSTTFFFTVLRVTTPILLAATASIIASKSGIGNIALEGIMLSAALFGVIGSGFSGNLFVGLICGILGGLLITFLLIYFGLYLKTDVVLSGIALNMLAIGGTVFTLFIVSGDRGVSTNIQSLNFPNINIPFIKDIPILGEILSGHNVLTYVSLILVGAMYYLLNKTTFGLRIRSVGENYKAAESVGINVFKVQVYSLIISGIIASFGGMYMSMGYLSNFSRNMVSGRGYIALAADAMGQSSPIGTLIASLIFGSAESLSYLMQSSSIPSELVRSVPYIVTIVGLIIYSQFNKRYEKYRKRNIEEV